MAAVALAATALAPHGLAVPAATAQDVPVIAAGPVASASDTPEPRPTPMSSDPPSATMSPPAPTAGTPLLALTDLHVTVPRLGIDLPLRLGDLARDVPGGTYAGATPEWVALLFPTSARPGSGGNSYIYAHARTGMFLSLWGARVGDEVLLTDDAGRTVYRYVVTTIVRAVPITDTSWLDPGGPERLTLQTSTGPSPGDPRFIVIAVRVA